MKKAKIKFGIDVKKGLCRYCKNVVPNDIYYNLCEYLEGVGIHSPIIECDCFENNIDATEAMEKRLMRGDY